MCILYNVHYILSNFFLTVIESRSSKDSTNIKFEFYLSEVHISYYSFGERISAYTNQYHQITFTDTKVGGYFRHSLSPINASKE